MKCDIHMRDSGVPDKSSATADVVGFLLKQMGVGAIASKKESKQGTGN